MAAVPVVSGAEASASNGTPAEGQRRFRLKGATPNRVGMRFDPLMPFEEWRDLGPKLAVHAIASTWWLGDWLVFGIAKYDRRYKRAIAATRLDYQTLRNYAMVARRFELPRRRDDLSFQHHAEVCALNDEEQDYWLDLASANRWSRNELRRHLRGAPQAIEGCQGDPTGCMVRLVVESERERRWRDAALRHERELEEWMVEALDRAAESILAAAEAQAG